MGTDNSLGVEWRVPLNWTVDNPLVVQDGHILQVSLLHIEMLKINQQQLGFLAHTHQHEVAELVAILRDGDKAKLLAEHFLLKLEFQA